MVSIVMALGLLGSSLFSCPDLISSIMWISLPNNTMGDLLLLLLLLFNSAVMVGAILTFSVSELSSIIFVFLLFLLVC